jgi:hypothetical protein
MCGNTTVNGHAFCQGLARLGLPTSDNPALQARAASIIYLISGVTLCLSYNENEPGVLCLPELVDMFHAREATEPLDRVYALLSLASDVQARGIFRPQYHVLWQELFI